MILNDIRSNPNKFRDEKIYNLHYRKINLNSIRLGLRNRQNSEFEDKIISFMREVLTKIQREERSLVTCKDMGVFVELDKVFKDIYRVPNIKILPHHWIEFDIVRGLIPTYPDFIVYGQLLYLWNVYVEKHQEYHQLIELGSSVNVNIKDVKYELDSLHTSLIVKSVTFVETYLYFLYFNISKSSIELQTEQAKGLIKAQRNVQDTDVIEKIVIKEFQIGMSQTELHAFKTRYKEYRRIANIRNRLIHASAFEKTNDNHLIYLITGSDEDLSTMLDFNTKFVLEIEDLLPESLKSLFWWNRENLKHPDYLNKQKGNLAVKQGFSV